MPMAERSERRPDGARQMQDTNQKSMTEGDGHRKPPRRCPKCKALISREALARNYSICPECNGYFRIHALNRIRMLADPDSFSEWDGDFPFSNPLNFDGYEEKIRALSSQHNLKEAVVTGRMTMGGVATAIGVMDSRFMMASMGHVVGEKITLLFERATRQKLPVVLFCCSGGARMQEGMISLMQMAKTSAAVKKHSEAGLLYVTVLTEPTTGGVTASFAMLGDIILSEPGAMIGFAGPRVIEQTIGQKLPAGFQRAEFQVEHGFVDRIVPRQSMRGELTQILAMHRQTMGHALAAWKLARKMRPEWLRTADDGEAIEKPTAWERVHLARRSDRPTAMQYIDRLFTDFVEFHGDRYYRDDPAVVGGIARFHGMPVTVIAQQKGKGDYEEILKRNFGMPSPDGYRKAIRLMKQAEKFHRPIICFMDTPGAFCGMDAEERGQGEAIARNLYEMSALKVPVLSVVIGEGGSGGALAVGVGDEVWMLENATYSVLSPEGFAAILWKDASRAEEAASVMKITAQDLLQLKVIERIIEERKPVTMDDMEDVCAQMDLGMVEFLKKYTWRTGKRIRENRYKRFRKF